MRDNRESCAWQGGTPPSTASGCMWKSYSFTARHKIHASLIIFLKIQPASERPLYLSLTESVCGDTEHVVCLHLTW